MPFADKADQLASNRRWYARNAETRRRELAEKRAQLVGDIRVATMAYLLEHPCIDCGEADPVVLEFDHRDPSAKLFSVAEAASRGFPVARVIEEIAKCDVRCCNCHRRRTAEQFGWWKLGCRTGIEPVPSTSQAEALPLS